MASDRGTAEALSISPPVNFGLPTVVMVAAVVHLLIKSLPHK